jgi:hypothetical protein
MGVRNYLGLAFITVTTFGLLASACGKPATSPESPMGDELPSTNCKSEFIERYGAVLKAMTSLESSTDESLAGEIAYLWATCENFEGHFNASSCWLKAEGKTRLLSKSDVSETCDLARAYLAKKPETKAERFTPTPKARGKNKTAAARKLKSKTPPSNSTGFEGIVFAPNGVDPVADALVYLPRELNPDSSTAKSGTKSQDCGEPDEPYIAKSCTDANGRFAFTDAKPGLARFKIRKGGFSRSSSLTLKEGASTVASPSETALPSENSSLGSTARFAVVQGTWDRLEKILGKIGVKEYYPVSSLDVLAGQPLDRFDVVLINCSNHTLTDRAAAWLDAYVRNGGRVYITDRAAPVITEALHPAFQTESAIQVPAAVAGEISDPKLRAWLKLVNCGGRSCANESGGVRIEGFMAEWKQITGIPQGATTLISSNGVPLTVMFNHGKGVVFYSSYHTFHEGDPRVTYPQERVLQYFLFKIM